MDKNLLLLCSYDQSFFIQICRGLDGLRSRLVSIGLGLFGFRLGLYGIRKRNRIGRFEKHLFLDLYRIQYGEYGTELPSILRRYEWKRTRLNS